MQQTTVPAAFESGRLPRELHRVGIPYRVDILNRPGRFRQKGPGRSWRRGRAHPHRSRARRAAGNAAGPM